MSKFCKKCGAKLDETTGLCPNCDADKLKNVENKNKTFGKKIRRFIFKFLLTFFLVALLVGGAVGTLGYFDIIDIPIVAKVLDIVGIKPISYDGSEDINYENYKIEPLDAEEYFKQYSDVIEEINANESDEVLTEAEAVKTFDERGFKDVSITTEYTMDGIYNDAYEISSSSYDKHPIYEAYYVNEKGELWIIMIINRDIMAIPVSYNLLSALGIQVVISESDSVTSYDSSTNKFYKNVPNESVTIVKVVEKIDAEALEELTIEVINTL